MSSLGALDQGCKACGIVHGNVGQNLTIEIDAGTLQTVGTLPLNWSIAGAVLSQDGKRIYIATHYMLRGGGPSVLVYDTETNQIASVTKMDRSTYQPLISPDGKRLYLTMIDSPDTIRVLDTEKLQFTSALTLPLTPARSSVNPLAFTPDAISPDGKQLYFVNSQGDVVWVIDTASLKVKATIKLH